LNKESRLSRLKKGVKVALSAFIPSMTPTPIGAPPVSSSIERTREIFVKPANKYEFYYTLVFSDGDLYAAVDAKASLVSMILKGFLLETGKELSDEERAVLDELRKFEKFLSRYFYDIAFKLIMYGNACYVIDKAEGVGIRNLMYLPMWYLTCVERREQIVELEDLKKKKVTLQEYIKKFGFGTQIFSRGIYVLNESSALVRQTFTADNVVHFDLGRAEEVRDLLGRYTLNVWNQSPLESLSVNLMWKNAIKINDMLLREVIVPKIHWQLDSSPYSPDLFAGRTHEDRVQAAQKAQEQAIQDFKDKLLERVTGKYPRHDKGYVTFDNVKADYLEPKVKYTSPNELLEQINDSIYGVTVPKTAVTGAGRGTYASELAVGVYTAIKAERLAQCIGQKFVELAKIHLSVKFNNKYSKYYDKIVFKLRKVLERHRLVRDAAILRELGVFTRPEIRELLDYATLTSEQIKELAEAPHRHTETLREAAATARRQITEARRPLTPGSKEQQQVT